MKEDAIKDFDARVKVLTSIVIGVFCILFVRLWFLQIMQGASIMLQSRENQTRIFRINAPRGNFYDRKGAILVSTRISHNVMVVPDDVKDKPEVIALLSRILNIPEAELRTKLKPDPKASRVPYQYIPLVKDVDPTTVVKLLEAKMDLPGVEVDEVPVRYYKYHEFASHLFGYIREISEQELAEKKNEGYRIGDIIGKSGLERTYEHYLRGVDGGIIFEVDIHDRPLRRLENREPQPGNNLQLTIDYKLQAAAEKALDEQFTYLQTHSRYTKAQSGLAVALDPRTGDVLAMVSKPGYDPNLFTGPISPAIAKQLYINPLNPLTNRVIQGEFAPGSTFKPLTVLAALMEGKVTLEDTFYCNGYDPYKGFPKCWTVSNSVKVPIHGRENIVDGIKNSCNIVMSELSRRLGVDMLARYTRKYHFGKPTGIDLYPPERKGFVPDAAWKRRTFKERWYPAETGYFAIGQGALTVTPIQLAQFYATLAMDGKMYRPRLVTKITNAQGEEITGFKPDLVEDFKIPKNVINIIKTGMEQVISKGTGASVFRGFPLDKYPVAGKTGTAQKTHQENENNGIFACFAPSNKPEIVIIVIVEQGGSGSAGAGPVARKMLDAYFNLDQPQKEQTPVHSHNAPKPTGPLPEELTPTPPPDDTTVPEATAPVNNTEVFD